ncbi:hypothetical protein ACSYAD_23520 [Acaryochloris marina NIES-2412]|uniref:hypothetical protein n=1 Tax=Acaryochloris marina TaxID=155978 RepID=UPI004057ED01
MKNGGTKKMERKKILIATKTYPSISTKYKETVCTAGILLNDDDDKPLSWVRIYPIRFRDLDFDKRYPRWSIISANIEKNDKDYREESYRIDDSSIKIIRKIDTKRKWEERKSFMHPMMFRSIQEIKEKKKSVGIIKPRTVDKYFSKITSREWSDKQKAVQAQMDFFEPTVELDKIPYQFGYQFTEEDGTSHRYTISDWEIMQLYRKCRDRSQESTVEGREAEALEKVRQKLEDVFLNKNDLSFIVGNLKNHSNTFMIIGLFYPLK